MPNEFPARELTNLVALFQRAHSKISALARMDDQIAAMVVQHERLQEEVRAVQNEINQEFERSLKFNQAPAKLPPTIGVTPTMPTQSAAALQPTAGRNVPASTPGPTNGDHLEGDAGFGGDVIPLARG
jgi:hypothetical protein